MKPSLLRWQSCLQACGLELILISASLGLLTACTPQSPEPLASQSVQLANQDGVKPPEEFKLKTPDGWNLVGDRYVPSSPAKGAIVLLHQRGGSAKDWQVLATALQKSNFTALVIDQRGAGRSTQGPGPSGRDAPWLTSGDIGAAIASLPQQGPVGLIGASYGANNALIYAASHPNQLKGIALFSPGANYHGLDALAAARVYRGPLVIYHSRFDLNAGEGPKQINDITPSKSHKLQIVNGTAHGSDLLTPEVISDTVKFFETTLKN